MDYTDDFNLQHKELKKIYVTLHLFADFTASLLFVLEVFCFYILHGLKWEHGFSL